MLQIKWRTGVGYGDFVTGLGYAYSCSIKYRTYVEITFYWNHSREFLFHPHDPETIVERSDYINSILLPTYMVTVKHVFNTNLPYRFFNQLDEFNPLHGLWYSTLPNTDEQEVVIWTTEHNAAFPGIGKDPAYRHWSDIKLKIKSLGYKISEITYRTPVKQALEIISRCRFGIGYDGLAHQLFKFMWKPVFVICERIDLNKLLVPQALLFRTPEEFLTSNLDNLITKGERRVEHVKDKHAQYLNDFYDFTKHSLYNKKIL